MYYSSLKELHAAQFDQKVLDYIANVDDSFGDFPHEGAYLQFAPA